MEKNKVQNKCLNRNRRVNREDYEQKRSEARNLFKKKKRELLKKKTEEIKESKEKKLTRKFYKGIKELNRPYHWKCYNQGWIRKAINGTKRNTE